MRDRLIALLLPALVLGVPNAVRADDGPAPAATLADDVLAYLGFDGSHKEDLRRGKVLYTGMPDLEVAPNELAVAGAVLVVRRPPAEVASVYMRGETFRFDPAIIAFESLDSDDAVELERAFSGIEFDGDESKEVKRLLKVEPGHAFNLSPDEMRLFRSIDRKGAGAHEQTMTILRGLLRERLQAYRTRGTPGIASYARKGGKRTFAGEELALAVESASLLGLYNPAFHDAVLRYPEGDQQFTEERFYWVKSIVDERPCFVLTHQMISLREDIAFGAERHFYVGHTYNSLLTLIGIAPFEGGTLVFGAIRTFTDKVTGFPSGVKKKVGRKLVAAKLAEQFESLRQSLER